jgi:hypothetical protein
VFWINHGLMQFCGISLAFAKCCNFSACLGSRSVWMNLECVAFVKIVVITLRDSVELNVNPNIHCHRLKFKCAKLGLTRNKLTE